MGQIKPLVFLFGPDRLFRRGKVGIAECANGHTDQIGHPLWLPIDVRATIDTEAECHRPSARRVTRERTRCSLTGHGGAMIEGRNAEDAAGATLTAQAIAQRNASRFALANQLQLTAVTGRALPHFHPLKAGFRFGARPRPSAHFPRAERASAHRARGAMRAITSSPTMNWCHSAPSRCSPNSRIRIGRTIKWCSPASEGSQKLAARPTSAAPMRST
jgi:hypothetical protein